MGVFSFLSAILAVSPRSLVVSQPNNAATFPLSFVLFPLSLDILGVKMEVKQVFIAAFWCVLGWAALILFCEIVCRIILALA